MKSKLKLIFSAFMVSNVLLINLWMLLPTVAQAQISNVPQANNTPIISYSGPEESIKKFLCVPNLSNPGGTTASQTTGAGTSIAANNPAAGDLATCVNKLYRFAGAIGAFAAVFFIALAGYYYILGGEKAKEKAKHMIISVIAGLVIIFTAYILLKQINPDAVKFKTIQPPTLGKITTNLQDLCKGLGLGDCIVKVSDSNVSKENDGGGGVYATCSGGLVGTSSLGLPNDGEADTKQICKDLGNKLTAVVTQYSQVTGGKYYFLIGQTVNPGTGPSVSKCHYSNNPQTGNCADLSPRLKSTNAKPATSDKEPWLQLCQAMQAQGIDVLVELISLQGCGHTAAEGTNATGPHFHVSLRQ